MESRECVPVIHMALFPTESYPYHLKGTGPVPPAPNQFSGKKLLQEQINDISFKPFCGEPCVPVDATRGQCDPGLCAGGK